jgi:four helix bundle protein
MVDFNLEKRTTRFGKKIIKFSQSLFVNHISTNLISQLVRSGTSIGANYREANNACSKKDFKNKVFICKKEANETKHWLIMIKTYFPEKENCVKILYQECHELILIFQSIINKIKNI